MALHEGMLTHIFDVQRDVHSLIRVLPHSKPIYVANISKQDVLHSSYVLFAGHSHQYDSVEVLNNLGVTSGLLLRATKT